MPQTDWMIANSETPDGSDQMLLLTPTRARTCTRLPARTGMQAREGDPGAFMHADFPVILHRRGRRGGFRQRIRKRVRFRLRKKNVFRLTGGYVP
jgi:hypothetical protein